ncbi:hypothetical protein ABFU61_00705 [Xanthomonas campestris pv. campestris]
MHQQIRGKVAQLDTTSGRASDATSERDLPPPAIPVITDKARG